MGAPEARRSRGVRQCSAKPRDHAMGVLHVCLQRQRDRELQRRFRRRIRNQREKWQNTHPSGSSATKFEAGFGPVIPSLASSGCLGGLGYEENQRAK